MDIFSGWPHFGSRGGYYEPRAYPRSYEYPHNPFYNSRNSFYDDEPEWYPEPNVSPFYRPAPSPFEMYHRTPFDDILGYQTCQSRKATRTGAEPQTKAKKKGAEMRRKRPSGHAKNVDIATEDKEPTSTPQLPQNTEAVSSNDNCGINTAVPMDIKPQGRANAEGLLTPMQCPEVRKIEEVMKDVPRLEEKVKLCSGACSRKEYLYIEESLVAILLKLDKIETNGNLEIRKARKSAVCDVQQLLSDLESIATSKVPSKAQPVISADELAVKISGEEASSLEAKMDAVMAGDDGEHVGTALSLPSNDEAQESPIVTDQPSSSNVEKTSTTELLDTSGCCDEKSDGGREMCTVGCHDEGRTGDATTSVSINADSFATSEPNNVNSHVNLSHPVIASAPSEDMDVTQSSKEGSILESNTAEVDNEHVDSQLQRSIVNDSETIEDDNNV